MLEKGFKLQIHFKSKEIFFKIDGLTPTVDSQIRPFFTRFENRTSVAYETMQNDLLATNRFKAPIDWKGCYSEGQKVEYFVIT